METNKMFYSGLDTMWSIHTMESHVLIKKEVFIN